MTEQTQYPVSSLLRSTLHDNIVSVVGCSYEAASGPRLEAIKLMVEAVGEYEHGTAAPSELFQDDEDLLDLLTGHYTKHLPTDVEDEADYVDQKVEEHLLRIMSRVVYEMSLVLLHQS